MADHGATELELMTAGNWKSANIARGYIRQSLAAGTRRAALIMGNEPLLNEAAPAVAPAAAPAPTLKAPEDGPAAKIPKLDAVPLSDALRTIFNNCTIQGPITINLGHQ